MNPGILFIITGDPRHSPRPAEAVRIAAGVGVWKKAAITVYLRAEAVRALGEPSGDLVDEEIYAQSWPMLAESKNPIYVQKGAPALREMGPAVAPFVEITDAQLAALAAKQNHVARF